MSRNRKNIWPTLILCATLLCIGGTAGFFLRPVVFPVAVVPDNEGTAVAAADDHGHGSSSVVEILATTLENMSLKTGTFEVRDYYQNIRIPAKIVERVPQSRQKVTAPIGGRVTRVLIAEGQAVRPGEKLFEFRITDEAISQSQIGLLDVIAQIEVNQKKLDRLKPLVDSGVVANKRILDVEFEIGALRQRHDAIEQELSLRGMDVDKIRDLIANKKLMQTIEIFAPKMGVEQKTDSALNKANFAQQVSLKNETRLDSTAIGSSHDKDEQYYTVESIAALEGTNQLMGASLCELTHHGELLIKGLAFESDIEKISRANQQGWRFTALFGEGIGVQIRENLKLYKIENHVDSQSQTYPIFVEIRNEIVSRTTDEKNRHYVNWRFKPGQRVHLEFPIDVWKQQVVIPLAALVRDGPEAFVFQKISHTHEGPDGTIHEFQKVPVKVLHTDKRNAVLAKNVRLDVYEEYALDQAYKLNLALKQAASGGGGHAGHDHPH